jgi:septal ring factor EnvC (AmiA/AmiB activator)
MSKKDLTVHEARCQLTELTCEDCKLVYKRRDFAKRHTDIICLREQLRQLRHESEENKRQLESDLEEHKRELQKFRQDCEERTRQLTEIQKLLSKSNIRFDCGK